MGRLLSVSPLGSFPKHTWPAATDRTPSANAARWDAGVYQERAGSMTTRLTRSRGTWVSLSHSAFHRAQGQSLLLLLSSQRPGSPSLFLLLMLLASAATKAVFILLHPVQQSLPYFIPAVFFRACCPLPKSVRASVEALGLPMCRWAVKTLLCFLRTDSAHRHGPAHTTGGCPFTALRDAELSVKSVFFPPVHFVVEPFQNRQH